jgi:hypothetical protein
MSNLNAKNIPIKGYVTTEVYLSTKAVFEPLGLSMSSAIGLGLQLLSSRLSVPIRPPDTAHRIRRKGRSHMPKPGLPSLRRAPRTAPGTRGTSCQRMLV